MSPDDTEPVTGPVVSDPRAPDTPTPGALHLGERVAAFDAWADALLEHVRGRRLPDAVFTTASQVGDFSLIWHAIGLARATSGGRSLRQAVVLAGLLGAESLVVNQGVKRLFRRARPTTSGDERYPVRRPTTTSFPSGHSSSAAFAAVVLSTWSPRQAPLYAGLAAVVATSRAYVRIHYASDVLAGAAVGLTLGLLARPLVRRLR
jgi:undecaprenyl-diphosphatase